METGNSLSSCCRYCRYYSPEGRRGGTCGQLGVPVQASWKACCLALPPFAASWEGLEHILNLPDKEPVFDVAHPLNCAVESPASTPAKLNVA
ncbi:MAG: hypothetical protein VKL59_05105 [Nostocaceae cyanobacterium]|nr:hypothetical protein [Nostocaceae cyanobacterium]